MKKQKKEFESLHDEQFKVLKRNEMFNINGGKPNQKTKSPAFKTYDSGSGYEIDSFELPDGVETPEEPPVLKGRGYLTGNSKDRDYSCIAC